MNITEFLLARIAEDEELAKGATPGPWTTMTEETADGENIYYTVEHGTEQLCDMALTSRQGWHDAEHIAHHDPARVLAECAAKRAIIEEHSPVDYSGIGMKSPNACNLCGVEKTMSDWEWDENSYPCNTLRALAAIYADHPDYQEAWAVGG